MKRGGRALTDETSDILSDENSTLEMSGWNATQATPHRSTEAADIIGQIMMELGSIEKHDEPVEKTDLSKRLGKISDMLYGVKSQLLQSASKEVGKLDFSPYSNGTETAGGDENSVVKTPAKGDVLKNYMRNQLELQESEWENYEEAINSLAEQLEQKGEELEERDLSIQRLTDERDDLVSTTTTLGERIQGLGQEKYQLLMEREEWSVERKEMLEKEKYLSEIISSKEAEVDSSNKVCALAVHP